MHMHIAISSQFRHASNSGVRLNARLKSWFIATWKMFGSIHASEPGCKEMKKCFSKLWIVAQINLFDLGKGTETIFKFCRFPRDI